MLQYSRNKLISIVKKEEDALFVHGVLDDDIYGIEIDVSLGISDLQIKSIDGKWNRWTTPECPRAIFFLQEAVGFRVEDGFTDNVHKIIGRKGCRHFANLLVECCFSAKEAVQIIQWKDAVKESPDLSFDQFMSGKRGTSKEVVEKNLSIQVKEEPVKDKKKHIVFEKKVSGEFFIDLHVHTSPASPCSSAPLEGLIQQARSIGLDGICLTDHNYVWAPDLVDKLREKNNFLILAGNEVITNQGDMLVFGVNRDIKGIIKLEELRDEVDRSGGFIIVPHPFRGFLNFGASDIGLTTEKAAQRSLFKHVDAVEVLNGKVTKQENDFASKVAATLGLPITGGSDAHEVAEVGKYATCFSSPIKNEKDLVNALKSGNYSPVEFKKKVTSQ